MKKVMMGNHAASHAVRLARVQVIAAYPITPQTQIVEELSEMCAKGALAARFLKVESEHSAMAAMIAAASAGVRCFTATSSQGLALMHELLHWAAGARLPLVMCNVNRALAPGWNIWADQTDSLAQRDTGWCQLYVEDNQEVLDTVLQAYRVAEQVRLPVMVCYDAFLVSHTYEPVDIPSSSAVDAFLPPWQPQYFLNTAQPQAFNALVAPPKYMELRVQMQQAMEEAVGVFRRVDQEFARHFGRSYRNLSGEFLEDADTVLITAASMTSPARLAVRHLRQEGHSVGLLKIRLFRPFPIGEIRHLLRGKRRAVVVDRNISLGKGGIFADEVRAAVAGQPEAPQIYSFVAGLGGGDITPAHLEAMLRRTLAATEPPAYKEMFC